MVMLNLKICLHLTGLCPIFGDHNLQNSEETVVSKKQLAALFITLLFAACSQQQDGSGKETATPASAEKRSEKRYTDKISLGDASSPVTITARICFTCGGSDYFFDNFYPEIEEYVQSKQAKVILTPGIQSHPAQSISPFILARCVGNPASVQVLKEASADGGYEDALNDWKQQKLKGNLRDALKELGNKFNLSGRDTDDCLNDEKLWDAVKNEIVEENSKHQSKSGRSIFVNDTQFTGSPEDLDDAVKRALDG